MRRRQLVLAFLILCLLGLGLGTALAHDSDRSEPSICVSAIGPVDAGGHGNPTAVESGDCPERQRTVAP